MEKLIKKKQKKYIKQKKIEINNKKTTMTAFKKVTRKKRVEIKRKRNTINQRVKILEIYRRENYVGITNKEVKTKTKIRESSLFYNFTFLCLFFSALICLICLLFFLI